MAATLALATWSFGRTAVASAQSVLAKPAGNALDAVEAGCRAVEDDPSVQTVGLGGLPARDGQVSLDGSVMLSPNRCGSVCFIRRFNHPVSIARAVMEKTDHVLLAGEGAESFAEHAGFEPCSLTTDASESRWRKWIQDHPTLAQDPTQRWSAQANVEERPAIDPNEHHDTVGVLALDQNGTLAGACSTSGLPFKVPGRVGDSPIIGQGLYVHPKWGAAVATGSGELMMGLCSSFAVVEAMGRGATPAEALAEHMDRVAETYPIGPEHQVGMIALRRDGIWSSASLRPGFSVAMANAQSCDCHEPAHVLLA
jgi:N4-(beta-N-acetylglucosaminyl)-L-asparaginase